MSSGTSPRTAVLGTGGWGTALAVHLARNGHDVALWGRDQQLVAELSARRANPTYLPDVMLPARIQPTGSLRDAAASADHIVIAVPSHGVRTVVRQAAAHIPAGAVIVSATKGLETETLHRMSEVILEETRG